MKKLLALMLLLHSLSPSAQEALVNTESCAHWMSFFKPACQRLNQVWTQGDNELYLTGYSWHNRYTYRKEKIKTFNELAWGGGLGKGLFDEKGNWHGLYAMAFLDSHRHVQPAAGYAYLKVAQLSRDLKAGLGYAVVVTSRVDINHNIPFPGVVPWASIFFKRATLGATYIPGTSNNGNVLFLFVKYNFSG
ncbi:MAG: lipid IV(A) palmitoyltransferase PagP [Legionella sp.]